MEDNVKIGWDKETNAPAGLNSVGSFAGSISGTFVNCVSYADLYGNSYVGGIAATKAQSMGPYDFRNCAFLGSITATGEYVGGIAGVGYYSESAPNTPCAKIQNCYVAANIVGKTCVGGICCHIAILNLCARRCV